MLLKEQFVEENDFIDAIITMSAISDMNHQFNDAPNYFELVLFEGEYKFAGNKFITITVSKKTNNLLAGLSQKMWRSNGTSFFQTIKTVDTYNKSYMEALRLVAKWL